mmetsp:Transcript_55713/g.129757  ORF Transcript_55713/g.129757 Transcript_55713/m.129757 type:complete len:232 (+) Transcript_55713:101-796(+)
MAGVFGAFGQSGLAPNTARSVPSSGGSSYGDPNGGTLQPQTNGIGGYSSAMVQRNSLDIVSDVGEEDDVYVQMDPLSVYESTGDLDARLADFCNFEKRSLKKPPDHITMEDVQGEMDELKTEKDQDESVKEDIKRSLERLTKQTVIVDERDRQQLTPARICEIENRLETDPSLRPDGDPDMKGLPWNVDEAARLVKRQLIRTYGKIRKSSPDLSQVALHQIEFRIQILKKV